jgi:hypothetical protein
MAGDEGLAVALAASGLGTQRGEIERVCEALPARCRTWT